MNRIRFDILPGKDKKEQILKGIIDSEELNNITIPKYAFFILTGDIANLLVSCLVVWGDDEKETNDVFGENKRHCVGEGIVISKLENIDEVCQ